MPKFAPSSAGWALWRLDSKNAMGSGTFKIAAGSVATIAGIALAPPTGGLTAFIAGLGAILWADGFREDAVLDNEHRSASSEREELLRRLRELEKTLD